MAYCTYLRSIYTFNDRGIKDMPGQYLNLGQILPKKLIQMYLTYTMIKTKKTHVAYLRGKRS